MASNFSLRQLTSPRRDCEVKNEQTENYASVWDAIADTPEQAANLRARAELMQNISVIVKEQGWVQTEAA